MYKNGIKNGGKDGRVVKNFDFYWIDPPCTPFKNFERENQRKISRLLRKQSDGHLYPHLDWVEPVSLGVGVSPLKSKPLTLQGFSDGVTLRGTPGG
jgi:hypothetical protein